jgi:NAD(P) transhydrogenase
VRAWDVRDVSDQAASLGASWITVDFKESGDGAGGYAKESSAEFQAAQKETFHKHLKECEIVISTAAIPGRASPVLIEEYMVKDMKPGSVIVDLAAAGGGNCNITKKDEKYVTDNGVTIIGYTDLPGRMAGQASAMYANNLMNLLGHISPKEKAAAFFGNIDGALAAGEEGDIVTRSIVCTKDGKEIAMPPPPSPTPVKKKAEVKAKVVAEPNPFMDTAKESAMVSAGTATLLGMGVAVSPHLLGTFTLAGAAGYQAVWGVKHALHTPLMSVTNAISGATAFGGLLIIPSSTGVPFALASLATIVSSVNIFGGFVVSQRMLDLFKRPGDQDHSYLFAIPASMLIAAPIMGVVSPEISGSISALMCLGAIGGLASFETAQMGCKLGMAGMAGGLTATMLAMPASSYAVAGGLMGAGAVAGVGLGSKVDPIALPQTVAAFHSLVGLAAMVTSIASYQAHPTVGCNLHNVAAIFGDFIGGVTLTGSLVAFGKLNGNLGSAAMNLPGKNMINIGCFATQGLLMASFLNGGGLMELWATVALSNAMGYHLVSSVGGADMPVCITVLNSYSGWALVAEGFLLDSPLLTVIGSTIGMSGAILTKIMCDAMNRDIANVIFGGMNVAPPKKDGEQEVREHIESNVDVTANYLAQSSQVMVVPGYGMAVARAQNPVASIAQQLRAKDIAVRFGIHPVAGRMPGQMNVLLAEAGVPYDWVFEMDEINPDMDNVDTCLIVGANDVTNSAAQDDPDSPLAGMPVIEVWKAKKVIFMKRTMNPGYADIDNPVFFKENTEMLLGDAKDMTEKINSKLTELL